MKIAVVLMCIVANVLISSFIYFEYGIDVARVLFAAFFMSAFLTIMVLAVRENG